MTLTHNHTSQGSTDLIDFFVIIGEGVLSFEL